MLAPLLFLILLNTIFMALEGGFSFHLQRFCSTAFMLIPSRLVRRKEYALLFIFHCSGCHELLIMGGTDRSSYSSSMKYKIAVK